MYNILRTLFTPLLKQFFSQIKVEGSELIETGPVLIIANHHNQMLDPFLVACAFKRECWFLAKSTLFKNPYIAKFLNSAHMIPVYRVQDDASNMHKNDETFRSVIEHLHEGKAVVIFPEGTSRSERKIGEFKTGAARIALQAEAAKNFTLNLKIQAIGLTYSSLTEFRSSVSVRASEPLQIASIESNYRNDARATVNELTENLSELLKNVSVELPEENQKVLAEKIAQLVNTYSDPQASRISDYELYKRIAVRLQKGISLQDPSILALETRIERFLTLSKIFGINSRYLESTLNKSEMYLMSGIVIVGALLHYAPYRLTGRIVEKISADPVLLASNKFTYGVVVFSAYYLFLGLCVAILSKSIALGFVSFGLSIGLGFLTNKYLEYVRIFIISELWPSRIKPVTILKSFKDELLEDLIKIEKM